MNERTMRAQMLLGVGELTLIDQDTASRSNINRQLCALESTLDLPKAEVMAARARDINPDITVHTVVGCYTAAERERFFVDYDYVVDAIDLVSCKVDLIMSCRERGIPIISALGTGNKRDASLLEITDISKTYGCALARVVRKELRARGASRAQERSGVAGVGPGERGAAAVPACCDAPDRA